MTRPPRPTADDKVEPTTWDALIGGAIGLLLIYAAGSIPYRILSWLVLGLGWLFVVVMFPSALVMIWQRLSGHVQPAVSRLRGDVRTDPRLGRLTRDRRSTSWEATLDRGDRTVTILIAGTDEPDARLVVAARDLVARFDSLEPQVMAFVASEAETFSAEDPEMAGEVRALRISSFKLWYPECPDHVLIEFAGPDEDLYWSCDYVAGEFSGLDYNS